MKSLLNILKETIKNNKVICDECGWSWKINESGDDKYLCHKCGNDNTPKKSNLDIVIDKLGKDLIDEGMEYEIDFIKKYIKNYITKNGFNVKYLQACTAGFAGVRTKKQIIVCSPQELSTLGDFIYTIFHEIRHDQQIANIKMPDPLSEMDLDDFSSLYKQYWEMELDADQFAKNKLGTLVSRLEIPMALAKRIFGLSPYIEKYPTMSKMVESHIFNIINGIKQIKSRGESYEGIHDHPLVKPHLDKLKDLI